jgi:hypothetical protein
MCSDAAGDLYVTDINYTGTIDVYTHGAIQPTGEVPLPGFDTNGCSVDPSSGDLAVADFRKQDGKKRGGVSIFTGAQGTPAFYQDPDIDWYFGCTYDSNGNLYVAGATGKRLKKNDVTVVAELPRGGTRLQTLNVTFPFAHPTAPHWDGKYLVLGPADGSTLNRYVPSASGLALHGTISFTNGDISQYVIQNGTLVATAEGGNAFGFWRYPQGGVVIRTVASNYSYGYALSAGSP